MEEKKMTSNVQNAAGAATGSAADVEEIMKKYDRESNTRPWTGVPAIVIKLLLAAFSLFMIYMNLFTVWDERIRRPLFLGIVVIFVFVLFPARKSSARPQKVNYIPWYDVILAAAGAFSFFYFVANNKTIINHATHITTLEIWLGVIGIIVLAECCRRVTGIPILVVAGCFVIYAFWTNLANGKALYKVLRSVIYNLFYTTTGVIGTPIGVCSTYIVLFIIFGAFLEATGIADFFIQCANMVAGAASGGPAKVAVISSALCGMVSGSSVGNTVTTGSVTIPMMKSTGYPGEFAGAVEAAASTGGQIMPPIMGAAAFLMADIVGTPYSNIIVRAIIPAVLYFTGIFIAVHLEAKKNDLKGIPREQLPKMHILIRNIYLLIPIVVLVWLVSTNKRTIQSAAAIAIVLAVVVSMFDKKYRMTPAKILDALAAGGKGSISVGAACGIAGIIAGTITMTGLANVLINGIVALAGSRVIIALVLTMLCCIVLGMGVPTTANYCIMAATCAPILIRMGVPTIAAHFFVFYFGIVADITPPVALAAYAGAAIAQANPMRTALNATKLAIAAFIVPYILAMNPVMVLVDVTGPLQIVGIVVTSLIGIFGVSAGLAGYFLDFMNWPQRILAIVGGLMLIDPSVTTDIIGIVLVALVLVWQMATRKKTTAAAA